MLIIKTNQPNSLVVTVSQNSELTNPEYLFSFTHIFSKQNVSFIPTDVSLHKSRYDEFYFVEGTGVGEIHFPYEGLYLYSISEQTMGSGNLNPALAYNVVENGEAQVIVQSAITVDSQFDTYISPNEDNSNIIFAPDEPNPTPNITPSPTPTQNPFSPTPSPTPTTTPTPTPSSPTIPYNSFIVASGSTFSGACSNLAINNTFQVWVDIQNPANCTACLPYNCFPCVSSATDTWWLDAAFTIPLPDMWIANYISPPSSLPSRQQIVNQQIVGATFTAC